MVDKSVVVGEVVRISSWCVSPVAPMAVQAGGGNFNFDPERLGGSVVAQPRCWSDEDSEWLSNKLFLVELMSHIIS